MKERIDSIFDGKNAKIWIINNNSEIDLGVDLSKYRAKYPKHGISISSDGIPGVALDDENPYKRGYIDSETGEIKEFKYLGTASSFSVDCFKGITYFSGDSFSASASIKLSGEVQTGVELKCILKNSSEQIDLTKYILPNSITYKFEPQKKTNEFWYIDYFISNVRNMSYKEKIKLLKKYLRNSVLIHWFNTNLTGIDLNKFRLEQLNRWFKGELPLNKNLKPICSVQEACLCFMKAYLLDMKGNNERANEWKKQKDTK
jgi:hypothetical protein